MQSHKILIAQSNNEQKDNFGRMSVECIPDQLVIEVDLAPIKKEDMIIIGEKVKNYSAICSLIMMVLIYNSVNELEQYNRAYNQRLYVGEL